MVSILLEQLKFDPILRDWLAVGNREKFLRQQLYDYSRANPDAMYEDTRVLVVHYLTVIDTTILDDRIRLVTNEPLRWLQTLNLEDDSREAEAGGIAEHLFRTIIEEVRPELVDYLAMISKDILGCQEDFLRNMITSRLRRLVLKTAQRIQLGNTDPRKELDTLTREVEKTRNNLTR